MTASPQGVLCPVLFADGTANAFTLFRAEKKDAPLLVIFPALGVRASYYGKCAMELRDEGFHVATVDHRGHGHSSVRASRRCDFGYREQVELEYVTMLDLLRSQFPRSRVIVMGHSIGSQMGALLVARHPHLMDGFVINAGCSVYHRGWGSNGWAILLLARLSRIAALLFGYYPGKLLRFGGREGRGIMRDWARTAVSGKFQATGEDFDYDSAMARSTVPVLGITYDGDGSAPPAALTFLLDKFGAAHRTQLHLADAAGGKCDHYTWVRKPHVFLPSLKDWLVW